MKTLRKNVIELQVLCVLLFIVGKTKGYYIYFSGTVGSSAWVSVLLW